MEDPTFNTPEGDDFDELVTVRRFRRALEKANTVDEMFPPDEGGELAILPEDRPNPPHTSEAVSIDSLRKVVLSR